MRGRVAAYSAALLLLALTGGARAAVRVDADEVIFSVRAPEASEVYLVGDFNRWNPTVEPMAREGDEFVVRLFLVAGTYRYKFVVDSVWRCSPDQPQDRCDRPCEACPRCVPNLFGSVDRIVIA